MTAFERSDEGNDCENCQGDGEKLRWRIGEKGMGEGFIREKRSGENDNLIDDDQGEEDGPGLGFGSFWGGLVNHETFCLFEVRGMSSV